MPMFLFHAECYCGCITTGSIATTSVLLFLFEAEACIAPVFFIYLMVALACHCIGIILNPADSIATAPMIPIISKVVFFI